jgi:hypothetical protein
MIKISWTLPVDEPGSPDGSRLDRPSLWRALLHKAENPVGYVPAITECAVVERYPDGFLREARRGARRLVQRVVTDEAAGRITFQHLDDDWISEISNEMGTDEDGRLTLTLALTLASGSTATVLAESTFLHSLHEDFAATLEAMTAVLRTVAAAPTLDVTRSQQ